MIGRDMLLIIVFVVALAFFSWAYFFDTTTVVEFSHTPINGSTANPQGHQHPTTTPGSQTPIEKPNTPPSGETPNEIIRASSKNVVVFTFDAGSGNQSIEGVLQALKEHQVRGTFFLTGKWAEENPTFVKRISDEGHEIFNHTYTHPYLTKLTKAQIQKELIDTQKIIYSITGKSTQPFFRPPYGDRNAMVLEAAGEIGYQSVYWTVDALDWKPELTSEQVKNRVLSDVSPGAIYLMHVGDTHTGAILDGLLDEVKKRGFTPVSLSEALIY